MLSGLAVMVVMGPLMSKWVLYNKTVKTFQISFHLSGEMFLLVLAHPGCPGQIPQSRKTVVCYR